MMERALSYRFYAEIKKLEPRFPTRKALLLPALHAAQQEKGWLPGPVLDEIAVCLGLHPAEVRETASFYTMFNLRPVGRHELRVCTNIACCLRGGEEILGRCVEKLGIQPGETTSDGRFTLVEEECLGACGTAPAMMVGDGYYENLDLVELDKILEKLK